MEYPRCAQHALDHIEGSMQAPSTEGGIPGIGEASEEMGGQLAQEFIFCEINSKGHHKVKSVLLLVLCLFIVVLA